MNNKFLQKQKIIKKFLNYHLIDFLREGEIELPFVVTQQNPLVWIILIYPFLGWM